MPNAPGEKSRKGRAAGAAASLVAVAVLAACGSDSGDDTTLTWYTNPDSGGQAEIAARCTEAAGGAYTIETAQLPRESSQQREQLIRRLAAEDDSIDLMSLDPPYIPEFAEAGFLAPVPEDVAERVTEGVVQSAVEGSTWDDELVAVPFWANTQLLWYKQSAAEAAGLDMEEPVTWEQLAAAAEEQGTQIAAQGIRAEALTVWVNALIEGAGGSIIEETAEAPEDIELGLRSDAAVEAARVMESVAPVGGPAFSTAGEDANVTDFEEGDAAFMVNWPFVWPRALGAVEAGTLEPSVPEDYGWARYPRTVEGEESRPPYGGINIGVGAFSQNTDLAYEAAECIVSEENQTYYFVTNGNPAALASVYDDPEVLEVFPQAPLIRESLEAAAPRPQTVYYSEVSGALQRVYHPASSVQPGVTGEQAAELIQAVLAGEELL
ncbi:extracellular solute-binding protein [Blastococcus sp. MG754426]|uniref:extracellular solute-binding protein n=1 Tax=unclassified Blastococcus TaxID=2619396 RepID=UPI001EEFE4D1|nr:MULTISPECIES: extracellular solute-binding protein [unclassified Blastococcus]MCF6507852.1 extracellular solute-binding protein [Blastococcus sp. MG754426]MCF6512392.1 extracellular solute-binding protein [Blastococcus sp. MG754427]MCF6735432.1 extracellular solute-binding protein [Blastococcus sp. KM273129]